MAYIDPILTIAITIVFIRVAIIEIIVCVKELLQGSPDDEMIDLILEKIDHVNQYYNYKESIKRISKAGSTITIEVDYVIEARSVLDSVIIQDKLREEMIEVLNDIPFEKWLTFNFTADKEMADHVVEADYIIE
jgi:predicted Co/Zn/Cd cation transporter (cation efflux family)